MHGNVVASAVNQIINNLWTTNKINEHELWCRCRCWYLIPSYVVTFSDGSCADEMHIRYAEQILENKSRDIKHLPLILLALKIRQIAVEFYFLPLVYNSFPRDSQFFCHFASGRINSVEQFCAVNQSTENYISSG